MKRILILLRKNYEKIIYLLDMFPETDRPTNTSGPPTHKSMWVMLTPVMSGLFYGRWAKVGKGRPSFNSVLIISSSVPLTTTLWSWPTWLCPHPGSTPVRQAPRARGSERPRHTERWRWKWNLGLSYLNTLKMATHTHESVPNFMTSPEWRVFSTAAKNRVEI